MYGLEIPAILYKPKNIPKGKTVPTFIMPHGGPTSQYFFDFDMFGQILANEDYVLLLPNVRGSTGYGREFQDVNLMDWGGKDLEDVASGANYLKSLPYVDKTRIGVFGGSHRGFMTLIALTRKPEVFAAGVAVVPITDWQEVYELSDAMVRRFMEELFEGTPEKRGKLYRDRSPMTHISQIKAPVLIVCGRNDSWCPIQPVEKFVKKFEKVHHPHDFKVKEKEVTWVAESTPPLEK